MEDIQQLASQLASKADKMTQELKHREDAHIEREARFERVKKEMEERYKINDSILHLNVGGTKFSTYKTTLCKFEGSMLEAMFSGRHPLAQDSNGRYFIDRPSDPFKTILMFLQTGNFVWPNKAADRFVLKEELLYYGLYDFLPQLVLDSVIIREATLQFLRDNGVRAASLVYRRSRDGATHAKFIAACTKDGPLLITLKSKDYVIGMFIESKLTSPTPISVPSSWLFTFLSDVHTKHVALPEACVYPGSSTATALLVGSPNGTMLNIDVTKSMTAIGYFGFSAPLFGQKESYCYTIEELEVFHVTSYVPA